MVGYIEPAEVGGLWVPANPEHAKLGWSYDFEQTERIARAAYDSTGYDATMEVVEFVMAEADRRYATALTTEPAAPEPIAKGLLSDDEAKAAGLGKFGHHPDPAIDFEIEVESLHARLIDAKGGISKPGTDPETVVAVLEDIERAMTFRVGGDPSAVAAKQVLRGLEADARQATQPAAPEGRQEDSPRAYIVHAPEDDYYGTGPDRLQFHPLAQHDLDNGYRQTPLYGRPAEQAVTDAMVEAAAEIIYGARHVYSDKDLARAALKAAMEAGRHE